MHRYMIVAMATRLSLSDAVNGWMAEGWIPTGGVFLDKDGYLCQAMWKDYSWVTG